jgi:hypothetical protein
MADPTGKDITGTMSGLDMNGLIQAMALQQAQQQAQLSQQTQQANQQATQAQGQYQQAQQQPEPFNPLAGLLPALLGNVASVLSQKPEYSQRGAQTAQVTRGEMLQKRADNLQQLHDAFVKKADEAKKAGDLEAETKNRNAAELNAKRMELLKDQLDRQGREKVANIQASSRETTAGLRAGTAANGAGGDAKDIAAAIRRGDQPPDLKGLYRYGGPVRAELARTGFDYTAANRDWQAVQRSISSLNGPQQTRLRQAVETAYESTNVIDDLSAQLSKALPRGKYPVLNRAAMKAAINGLAGDQAQSLATQLDAQITDVASELGNAYMGGNSPTDHALKLAEKNLRGEWTEKQLADATKLARRNLEIRRNSIYNSTPINPGQAPPPMGTPKANDPGGFR